jgi:hypothetical protein
MRGFVAAHPNEPERYGGIAEVVVPRAPWLFSMGLFVARVQRGSHIVLEQTNVGDAVWVPQRLEVRGSARILFLKNLAMERIFALFGEQIVVTLAHKRLHFAFRNG